MRDNEIRIECLRKVIYPSLEMREGFWSVIARLVAMESQFLVCTLKRLDWTALNYDEFIDYFKYREVKKT